MRARYLLIVMLLCMKGRDVCAQEYSYAHYDVKDGLAGSKVYCITQDRDGFIWVGTEMGVSRFDGTHFVNFATADGLPDIEVLQIFGDSKGRVWMAPFRKSVCYYYKGKIYNQENDSLLKKIRFRTNIGSFAEDKDGNILIQERTALHLFRIDGSIQEFDNIAGRPVGACTGVSRSLSGNFMLADSNRVYELVNDRFIFIRSIIIPFSFYPYVAMSAGTLAWRNKKSEWSIWSRSANKLITKPFEFYNNKHVIFSIIGDSLVYEGRTNGATEYNINSGVVKHYLPGIEVSRAFRDDEGNTWFTTLGQGIYRLISEDFKNLSFLSPDSEKCGVSAINKWGNELFLGANNNTGARLVIPDYDRIQFTPKLFDFEATITSILQKENGNILLFGDHLVIEYNHDLRMPVSGWEYSVKSSCGKNDNELLIGGGRGLWLVRKRDLHILDTLLPERITAVYYRNDSIFAGTLNGLCLIKKDKSVINLGENVPFLRRRIASIASSGDGTLWIASFDDAGIIGYRNGKVIATLGRKQGMTSDICRTLNVHNNILWVGTDKGLNRIDLNRPGFPIVRYTSNDGLGSDVINTIFIDSSAAYVGTPVGLSVFNDVNLSRNSGCRLILLDVLNGSKHRLADTTDLQIPYDDNKIRFDFAGISYKSGRDIVYKYRLAGLDTNWKTTIETFLDYPTLPSGDYRLELKAINKFDVQSRTLLLNFKVTTPFWRTWWFYGLSIITFVGLTWLWFQMRTTKIRRAQEEKERLSRKMGEMEHMALQAQMNPHFIFNCLNSIQQYIFDRDILSANKYITGFAKLIRATLQHSTVSHITLADEIQYLSTYLSLEQMRFKEKMDYSIEVDPALNVSNIKVPPMLIQPYVENSMRHGLRHKTDGKGHIRIAVSGSGEELVIVIEDNGIGRQEAGRFKTREHIEYQSKGMSLTADRIRIINAIYSDRISTEVVDLVDEAGGPAGTRVIMKFFIINNPVDKVK